MPVANRHRAPLTPTERNKPLKFLRLLAEAIALLILAVFLLSNRAGVMVNFWPFGGLGEVALGAVILIALAAGLFIGLMLHWPRRIRAQRRARLAEARASALQARLDTVVTAPLSSAVAVLPERVL